MEVDFVQSLEDIIAFNIYHAECQPWWNRHRYWWTGCILVAVCVILGVFIYFGFHASPDNPFNSDSRFRVVSTILALMTFEGFWTAYAVATWRWRLARRVKQFVNRPENQKMLGWQHWVIQPEGLTIRTKDNENTIRWTGIARIAQSEEYVFLYETSLTANVVPQSAFQTDDDFFSFVRLARSYWKAARGEQATDEFAAPEETHAPDTGITRDSTDYKTGK